MINKLVSLAVLVWMVLPFMKLRLTSLYNAYFNQISNVYIIKIIFFGFIRKETIHVMEALWDVTVFHFTIRLIWPIYVEIFWTDIMTNKIKYARLITIVSFNFTTNHILSELAANLLPCNQHMENAYPGSNMLVVTLTNGESKRVEAQSDKETLNEAMAALKDMFGPDIPEATDILVPRWWNNRFQRGSYSNYPIISNDHFVHDIKVCLLSLRCCVSPYINFT